MRLAVVLLVISLALNAALVTVLTRQARSRGWGATLGLDDRAPSPGGQPRDAELHWTDARPFIEGPGWRDVASPYGRLPASARAVVSPNVWDLSQNSSGVCVRFVTSATRVAARWRLRFDPPPTPAMSALATAGLDLYVRDERGAWRWLGAGQPGAAPECSATLIEGLSPARREYLLYLPLGNGVAELELGGESGAAFAPAPPRTARPLVFYGTSIVQGICASRPGMAYPAIVGRRFDRAAINLGFSGHAKMEPEVVKLLGELDPETFILDCVSNMSAAEIDARAEAFIRELRRARPATPIVVLDDRRRPDEAFIEPLRARQQAARDAMRRVCERLALADFYYISSDAMSDPGGDDTVDDRHPSDLGMVRIADGLQPVLAPLLNAPAEP